MTPIRNITPENQTEVPCPIRKNFFTQAWEQHIAGGWHHITNLRGSRVRAVFHLGRWCWAVVR